MWKEAIQIDILPYEKVENSYDRMCKNQARISVEIPLKVLEGVSRILPLENS